MILAIFGAVFMLAVCIFIHELGHLLCGMMVGVKARIFSIGYGRGVWKKRINGTIYQITAIPLGGYVMFKGDEYGRSRGRPGELMATPPLKRMVPVLGGPLFNLLLGLIIFFVLAWVGDSSPGNRIFIDTDIYQYSPAYKSGLRTGDRILSIDGKPTESFEDIFTGVGLSAGEEILVKYERNGKTYSQKIIPDVYKAGGRPTIGVQPYGTRNVVVTFTYKQQFQHWLKGLVGSQRSSSAQVEQYKAKQVQPSAIAYLNDGDVILTVEGEKVATVSQLQTVLGRYQGKNVKIKVERKVYPLLTPFITETQIAEVPVKPAYIIEFNGLQESRFSEFSLPSFTIGSYYPNIQQILNKVRIDGKFYNHFNELYQYLLQKGDSSVEILTGKLSYRSNFRIKPIGLLGFLANPKFTPENKTKPIDPIQAMQVSLEKVYENLFISVKGLSMLFSGLISARDNLSGPIGIVQFAGISLEYGWFTYFDFVAKISIALMFMNLLPIPVADGGHLVLYAYEAIAGKPLPQSVIQVIFRIGFFFLLLLGILVSINDISRFF